METLIYILIGIAFFIFKVIQEAGKQKQEAQKKRPVESPQPFNSQKEKRNSSQPSRQTATSQQPRPLLKPKDNVDNAPSCEELRQVLLEAEKQKQSVKAPIESVSAQSISQTVEPEVTEEPYKTTKDNTNSYGEILSDHDSLKKAFVLSEILKRKEL